MKPAAATGCSTAGWEHVAFTAHAHRGGTLEVEVVDRLRVGDPVTRLMGPGDTRYLLATVAKEEVASGASMDFEWSFGSEPPAPEPDPQACRDLREAHADLVSDWGTSRMCTRETARVGATGASSSLFAPSCFSDRGWRPTRLDRPGGATGAANDWLWLAAWVWVPAGADVELHPDGDTWSFSVDGDTVPLGDGPYPAWTLRARLTD